MDMDPKNKFELTEMETRVVQIALNRLIQENDNGGCVIDMAEKLKVKFQPHSQNGFVGLCGGNFCRCCQ